MYTHTYTDPFNGKIDIPGKRFSFGTSNVLYLSKCSTSFSLCATDILKDVSFFIIFLRKNLFLIIYMSPFLPRIQNSKALHIRSFSRVKFTEHPVCMFNQRPVRNRKVSDCQRKTTKCNKSVLRKKMVFTQSRYVQLSLIMCILKRFTCFAAMHKVIS